MTLRCRICERDFVKIPDDAIPITGDMYRLSDGSVHDIRRVRAPAAQSTKEKLSARSKLVGHNRYHVSRGIKKEGCALCAQETPTSIGRS